PFVFFCFSWVDLNLRITPSFQIRSRPGCWRSSEIVKWHRYEERHPSQRGSIGARIYRVKRKKGIFFLFDHIVRTWQPIMHVACLGDIEEVVEVILVIGRVAETNGIDAGRSVSGIQENSQINSMVGGVAERLLSGFQASEIARLLRSSIF